MEQCLAALNGTLNSDTTDACNQVWERIRGDFSDTTGEADIAFL